MPEIITPVEQASNIFMPGIFLAGPIQGARDWQAEAISLIAENMKDIKENFFIASPRTKEWQKGYDFEAQIDWETKYLTAAGNTGVIMFWLCNESEHFCERAYAQTTRFELAEWVTAAREWDTKLVVGFDTKFSGTKYIMHRLMRSKIPMCGSLEETVAKTVEILKERLKDE